MIGGDKGILKQKPDFSEKQLVGFAEKKVI
jgi:hypothetical protein